MKTNIFKNAGCGFFNRIFAEIVEDDEDDEDAVIHRSLDRLLQLFHSASENVNSVCEKK